VHEKERQMTEGRDKQRPFRRLADDAPPWDKSREVMAGAMTVGAGHQWDLYLHFIPQADGRLYLFGLDIRPSDVLSMRSMNELPPGGITARVLHSVKLGEVLEDLRAGERMAEPDPSQTPADIPQPGARPGRRGLSDEFLSWVAVNYLKATKASPRAPVQRMQETLGSGYPRDTVKGWVGLARGRGFLGPTTQGKSNSKPGPRLEHEMPGWDVVDDQAARDRLAAIDREAR
jgi:hypothetical protein